MDGILIKLCFILLHLVIASRCSLLQKYTASEASAIYSDGCVYNRYTNFTGDFTGCAIHCEIEFNCFGFTFVDTECANIEHCDYMSQSHNDLTEAISTTDIIYLKQYEDACSMFSPCYNGATCTDRNGTFACTCPIGFTFAQCNIVDECVSQPCQNDGTCHSRIGHYECTCMPGFTGTNCETNIDECASNPCQNMATCEDRINSYWCHCRTGSSGQHCQDINMSDVPEIICDGSANPVSSVTVTVSSRWENRYDGRYICLNNPACWSVAQENGQWAQVDIGSERLLAKIGTKGDGTTSEWVTRYALYKMDGGTTLIGQFRGNSNRHTPVYHEFANLVMIRIVRIVPLQWYEWIGMRVGLFVL